MASGSGWNLWLHYTRRCFLLSTLVAMRGAVILHVRKLPYCSLKASEPDPCLSNFVSAIYRFQVKGYIWKKVLAISTVKLFMLFHLQIAPQMISEGLQGVLSAFIHTCRTNRKLLPTGLCCGDVSYLATRGETLTPKFYSRTECTNVARYVFTRPSQVNKVRFHSV